MMGLFSVFFFGLVFAGDQQGTGPQGLEEAICPERV